jgi:hypothetical protein
MSSYGLPVDEDAGEKSSGGASATVGGSYSSRRATVVRSYEQRVDDDAAAYSDERGANRNGRDFEWAISSRGRFATPADFPRHDGTPRRGLHVPRTPRKFGSCPSLQGPFSVATLPYPNRSTVDGSSSVPNPSNVAISQLSHRGAAEDSDDNVGAAPGGSYGARRATVVRADHPTRGGGGGRPLAVRPRPKTALVNSRTTLLLLDGQAIH